MPIALPPPRPGLRRAVAWLCAAAVALGPVAGPAGAQSPNPVGTNQLPALGNTVADDFGIGTERKLGDQIMREVWRDPDYLDDPLLTDYLRSLWLPLVSTARSKGEIDADTGQRFAWEPFLVRDRSVNAFALPGGYVGVHLGLIAMTTSSDELASVLAHELSHVTQRHIARGITNSRRQSLLAAAGMILGVLAASRSRSTDAASAVITGGQAAAIQGQLNFSRDMEREADRIGFGLLTGAGFAPSGMAAMFEKLDQASRLNDSGGFPYLRTHPLTTERIGEARARLGTASKAPPVETLEHALAVARARVLMDPRVGALQRWQALDPEPARALLPGASVIEPLAAAASSALASTLLRDWARADASLAHATGLLRAGLRAEAGRDTAASQRAQQALALLVAQSQLERGNPGAAAAALAGLPETPRTSRALMMMRAQVAMANVPAPGTAGAASPAAEPVAVLRTQAEALQTWVAVHPNDANAWQLLAQVWSRLDQPLRAVRAEAEGRYVIGDLTGAVDRLRAGQTLGRSAGARADFIESSVIDARLREIEGERRREMMEREEQRRGG